MGCIRLTTLIALPIAVSLVLVAVPGDVWAGLCKKSSLPNGCVNSADVANDSLGKVDVKDEAGLDFQTDTSGASVNLKAPRNGWAIVTASTDVRRTSTTAAGTLRCVVVAIRPNAIPVRKIFFESVNPEKGIISSGMTATLGFSVKKGKTSVKLTCKPFSGSVKAGEVGLVVQYFPTRY